MPVFCPINLPRISDDEMRSVDYDVMAHVFTTHNELGRLADETVYHHKLVNCLHAAGIEASTEVPIELTFRNFSIPLAMDLVVAKKVIYELKTVSALQPAHESQLLVYMFLTNTTHGKLVNFRTQSVESRFVNTSFTTSERQRFDINTSQYVGDSGLPDLIRELVTDWGTGLSAALYRRAVLHCWGQEREPEQLLPMNSGQQQIGNQRFHLLTTDLAIGVTTYTNPTQDNHTDFLKLLSASPLKSLQWLNITHRQVTLTTILRDGMS